MSAFPFFPSATTGKTDYVGGGGLGPVVTQPGPLNFNPTKETTHSARADRSLWWEPDVHHHGHADNFRRGFEIAEWVQFPHSMRLGVGRIIIKVFSSDNALPLIIGSKNDPSIDQCNVAPFPQQFLYFLPDPQGQGSFRPTFLPERINVPVFGVYCFRWLRK